MQIPSCIKLSSEQTKKLEKFEAAISKYNLIDDYEDVSMASPFTFSIYSTGIGDSIYVVFGGFQCCLTIADDGELIESEQDKDWLELLNN